MIRLKHGVLGTVTVLLLGCGSDSGSNETETGREAASGDDSCAPLTCETAAAQCGSLSDGCGGQLTCGNCSGTESCGGAGLANRCSSGAGAVPPSTWAKTLGGVQNDSGSAVTADSDGNVYLAWTSIRRSIEGDAPPPTGGEQKEGFSISKFAPDGTLRWTKEFPGPEVSNVALKWTPGALYLMGNAISNGGAIQLGGDDPLLEGFVVRYSPSGDFVSQKKLGAFVYSFDVDGSGNLIVSTVQPPGGGEETYAEMKKLDESYNELWSKRSDIEGSAFTNVSFDPAGNILSAGSLGGPFTFNGQNYGATGSRGLVFLKLTGGGTTIWAREARGAEIANLQSGRSAAGISVVLGSFNGTLTWGGSSQTTPPTGGDGTVQSGAFLITVEASGEERWLRRVDCPPSQNATSNFGLAVDPVGQAVVSCGSKLFKYALSGDLLWTRDLTTTGCSGADCRELRLHKPGIGFDRAVLVAGEREVADPGATTTHKDAVVFQEAP